MVVEALLGSSRRVYSRKCTEDRLAWDTYNNTQYHTPYANMTSLSIRLTVPLREVIIRDALRQHTAVARAPREQHTHTPSPGALEASSSHQLVAKLACTCLLRTPARTYARAHVSINTACSHAWLEAGRRGSDTSGVQREQRARRRAK